MRIPPATPLYLLFTAVCIPDLVIVYVGKFRFSLYA